MPKMIDMVNDFFVKKVKICVVGSFDFHQLMVRKFMKELQKVFLTSSVSNSNRNMEELECKI